MAGALTGSGGMVAAGTATHTITAGTTRSTWRSTYANTVIWFRNNGKFTRHDPIGVATDDWNDVYYVTARRNFFYGDDIYTPAEYAAYLGLIDDLENTDRYHRIVNCYR
jgi:hypothetical protein